MVNLVRKLMGKTPQKKVLNKNSILLVGLWNPDVKYSKTRHNIGADTLVKFLEKNGSSLKSHKSGMYRSAEIAHNDTNLTLLTPMVSMNNSGDSLRAYLKNKNINKDHYWKLKIGVGRPPSGVDPANYVLSKFNNEEREEVEFIIEDVIDVIKAFSENREVAIKQASERRIIDVI